MTADAYKMNTRLISLSGELNPTDLVFEFEKGKVTTTFGRETNGYIMTQTENEMFVAEKFRPNLTNSEEQKYRWVIPEEIAEFLKDKDGFIYPSNMYCIARVRNQDAMRAIRQKLYQNDDWHTSGITRFFVGWKVQKSKYRLEIQVTEGVTNIPGIGSNGLPEYGLKQQKNNEKRTSTKMHEKNTKKRDLGRPCAEKYPKRLPKRSPKSGQRTNFFGSWPLWGPKGAPGASKTRFG